MRTKHRLLAVTVSSLSFAAAAQEAPSTATSPSMDTAPSTMDAAPTESSPAPSSRAFVVEDPNSRPLKVADPVDRPSLVKRLGVGLDVGGGVHDFVDRGHSSQVDTGGAWAARLTVGTRQHIGGEVAYVGTANPVRNTLAAADRAVLVSNGVEGLLRVNALVNDWQPYAVAGYTYRRYVVQNSAANTSALADGTNSSEIPFGIGLAYRKYHFIGDLRGMVHPSVSSQLLQNSDGLPTAVSLAGKVGFEF